jgi:hypothetical protein
VEHEDSHIKRHPHSGSHEEKQGHADIEPVIVKRIGPHQKLAAEMKRSGIDCQALEVGSHPIEQKPHSSYMFAHSSRLVTNKGIVKVRGEEHRLCPSASQELRGMSKVDPAPLP